jgi:hypothetical protein
LGALTKEIFAYCFRKTVCYRLQEDQKEPLKDEYDQVIPAEMWDDKKTVLNIAVLKVKQSRNRPAMAQRVSGGLGSQIS